MNRFPTLKSGVGKVGKPDTILTPHHHPVRGVGVWWGSSPPLSLEVGRGGLKLYSFLPCGPAGQSRKGEVGPRSKQN
jgi:hypothetical protein